MYLSHVRLPYGPENLFPFPWLLFLAVATVELLIQLVQLAVLANHQLSSFLAFPATS